MMTAPRFCSHEQQKELLGCAADLDPETHPRRYELAKAREKFDSIETPESRRGCGLEKHRTKAALEKRKERDGIAEIAKALSALTLKQAAAEIGISYDRLLRIKHDYGLTFQDARARKVDG
ncbi:hypothetical protein ACIGCM_03770 [Pseudomonas sp. NPDC078700]|uniref:hypothetical protein n=1 Tax=Pseudomonas sp. NPDC078700 TaxID=3364424 RepID=UPI0037C6747E